MNHWTGYVSLIADPPPGFQEKPICAWDTVAEAAMVWTTRCYQHCLPPPESHWWPDEVLALNQWPLNAQLKDEVGQKEKKNKQTETHHELSVLSNPEMVFWLQWTQQLKDKRHHEGERYHNGPCIWAAGTGQSLWGLVSARSKCVECDSVPLAISRTSLREAWSLASALSRHGTIMLQFCPFTF